MLYHLPPNNSKTLEKVVTCSSASYNNSVEKDNFNEYLRGKQLILYT